MTDYTKPCVIDGKPVRILCTDRPGVYPVVAMTEDGNIYYRRADGNNPSGTNPILNAPERVSRFYRVYKNGEIGQPWATLASARSGHFVAAILEIEHEDGLPVSAKLHPAEDGK